MVDCELEDFVENFHIGPSVIGYGILTLSHYCGDDGKLHIPSNPTLDG